tara:strand:- start:5834 stop:6052 length:219 start_codon:yes stop_codon:yes gene_type:complete
MTLNTVDHLAKEVKQLKQEVKKLKDFLTTPESDALVCYEDDEQVNCVEFNYVPYLEHAHDELSQYNKIPKRY